MTVVSGVAEPVREPEESTGIPIGGRDTTAWWLALVAAIVSIASTVYFFAKGDLLLYEDAISHLQIAHRVLFSPTTGPVQLGYAWLPLPHILMLPFVWINSLYFDGLAGSFTSMASYVIASVLIYKIVLRLTRGNKAAALVGAFVFMANPNVLYMQSLPMTELLFYATILGGIYGLQCWAETEKKSYLFGGCFSLVLATLTRYEAWVLAAALFAVVVHTCLLRHYSWVKLKAIVLVTSATTFVGVLLWIAWSEFYFGNPLAFYDGKYTNPDISVKPNNEQLHHFVVSLKTYLYAIDDNLHPLVIGLALAGLLVLLIRLRLSPESLPTLATLVFVPFYVLGLYEGQRPMGVTQFGGGLLNVRYGLVMVLPAAILAGYLVSTFTRTVLFRVALGVACVVLAGSFTYEGFQRIDTNIATVQEPLNIANTRGGLVQRFADAGAFLRRHYTGGLILEQEWGSQEVLFDARISTQENVYEGSYNLWAAALEDPARSHIKWIVMRMDDWGDQVFTTLHDSSRLKPYKLVYDRHGYRIYERS